MPFIRQTRDRRGFDHTFVMHVARPGGGAPQTRVLYLFRSPAHLKVGRTALDAEVMEALEHTHPDLTFDWSALQRDAVVHRPEPTRPPNRDRPGRQRPRSGPPPPVSSPIPRPEAVPDDPSLLGRTLGAAEAARVRRRHSDLTQRIGRRSRTPEERTRLFERAGRLNPDGWVDEAAIRAHLLTFDADCDGISAELPSRRRGRRGGRARDGAPPGPSGIMAKGDERNGDSEDAQVDRPSGAPDPGGDAGVSPAASSATDVPNDD